EDAQKLDFELSVAATRCLDVHRCGAVARHCVQVCACLRLHQLDARRARCPFTGLLAGRGRRWENQMSVAIDESWHDHLTCCPDLDRIARCRQVLDTAGRYHFPSVFFNYLYEAPPRDTSFTTV